MKKQILPLLVLILLFGNLQAQFWHNLTDKKGSWGVFKIPGQNTTAPMVLFNRPTISEDTAYVKNCIRNKKSPYYFIYKKLFEQVTGSNLILPQKGDIDHGSDQGAEWAKNAAFVYFMNIDTSGSELDPTVRNSLRHEALNMLYFCNARRGKDKFGAGTGDWEDIQQHIAEDIINMCITFELLRAGGASQYLPLAKDELQLFVGIFYRRAAGLRSTLSHYLNNNLTLRSAAALGMASVVLHDRGAGLFKHHYKPNHWAGKAHARIRQTMFSSKRRTQAREIENESSGYFEGPGYFSYAAELLLPFFVAYDNFVGNKEYTRIYFEHDALAWNNESVTNYKYNVQWQMMFGWFNSIVQPKGIAPTFDDTNIKGLVNICTFDKDKKYSLTGGDNLIELFYRQNYDARADVLAYNNEADTSLYTSSNRYYSNGSSGNFVIKTNNNVDIEKAQYLHFLCEPEINADNWLDELGRALGHGHEHPDHGSFTISAGSDMLAIDPPYMGYSNRHLIDNPSDHNVVTINGDGPDYGIDGFDAYFEDQDHTIVSFVDYDYHGTNYKRKISLIDEPGSYYYYEMEDNIESNSWKESEFYLHGNGNESDSHHSADVRKLQTEHSIIWKYPCNARTTGWKLYAKVELITDSGGANPISQYQTFNDDGGNISFQNGSPAKGYEICDTPSSLSGFLKSEHTTLSVKAWGKKIKYHSLLIPLECNNDTLGLWQNGLIGGVKSWQKDSFNIMLVKEIGPFQYTNLHFNSLTSSPGQIVNNPFQETGSDSNQTLEVSGSNAFFSVYKSNSRMQKSCSIATRFHETKISNGTKIKLNDTTYIEADKVGTFSYKIMGKLKYHAKVTTLEATNIKFYIPDAIPGYRMTVKDSRFYSIYNDTTHVLSVNISGAGKFTFALELEDPCLVSCYFPPTTETIHTEFNFNDGTNQSLSHKLDIIKQNGNLVISNGSQMEISCNKYLRNQDSLILISECDDSYEINTCEGIGKTYVGVPTSLLIVNNGSALVLDNGSYTHVGNGSAIVVKSGGTLILKNGSFLQVGDSKTCGKGQLIVEPGASVYIQPAAHIEFFKKIGDTLDRHLINIPSTVSPGVNYAIDSLLIADQIIDSIFIAYPICKLDSIMSPAVYNNDWGYASFMPPVPNIKLRKDTICPGEPMVIDLKRILNDNKFSFEVCRVDSYWVKAQGGQVGYWKDTCVLDTILIDTIDPERCYPPNKSGDRLVFYFTTGSLHRVTISAGNDCGLQIDSVRYVYVRDTPNFEFTLPSTACSGFGNVKAIITQGYTGSYSWDIDVIDTAGGMPFIYNMNQKAFLNYHKEFTGTMPDTFDFPDFNFLGGRKYQVSLSVINDCQTLTKVDTIVISAGSYIQLEKPTLYANPIHGARQVQLHGYISEADSFRWEPSTWLNRNDTLVVISSPEDSISYVLLSFSGSCLASDTVFIKYNHVANSGIDDTVCYSNSKVLLGNGYDLSVFLGFLYFKDGNAFRSLFTNYTNSNNEYFRYLSSFMQSEYFKDWANNCNSLYTDFTEDLLREQTIQSPWFINYFEQLTAFDNADMTALDTFVFYVNNDATLKDNYINTGNWGLYGGCMTDFFTSYDDFLANHLNEIGIAWMKVVGSDTTFNGSLQESSIAIDEPSQTSIYIQQVITPQYAEFDETLVIVDTIPVVSFAAQFQMDSTVLFENLTEPVGSASFSWDFGDGSATSNEVNPIHTFPSFDTSFVVCLTATNTCGNYSWCDTIYIDSAHWGGSFYIEKESQSNIISNIKHADGIQSLFYPNPSNGNGTLYYKIEQEFEIGSILIFDNQGKSVFALEFNKPTDRINIKLENESDGLYFYIITTNSGHKVTGKILKQE
jgi:PKD repeat protein